MYENPKQWDLALAKVEFVYNDSPNRSTGMSPFQIVYGMNPRGVYELRNFGGQERRSVDGENFASCMHEIQDGVKKKLQESACKYKQREDMKERKLTFRLEI